MNRRGFLRSMFALAATAAAAPSAMAVSKDQPNKYREAIRLLDLCVAAEASEFNPRFDQLLVHLRSNFEAPEYNQANLDATAQILINPSDIAGIRGIPPNVADSVYPIALAKLSLTVYQLPIQPSTLKEFDWFHKTYGRLIIRALDPQYNLSAPKQKKTV